MLKMIEEKPIAHPQDTQSIMPFAAKWFGSWRVSLDRRAFSATELQRTYDNEAPDWSDKIKRLKVDKGYEAALKAALETCQPFKQGQTIRALDCGVGCGDLSIALSKVISGKLALEAFDISPNMLDEATRQFNARDIKAKLFLADARNIPVQDNSFDLVMTAHMLEHTEKPFIALSEMMRVLKPGGLMIVFITRRSLQGLPIQLKWRVHAVTPRLIENWLAIQGLEQVRCVSPKTAPRLNKLSVVCMGQKPVEEMHGGDHE